MKSFKVRCFFCKNPVLDFTCDMVKVSRVVNTRPLIEEKKMVYRCAECKVKQKEERERRRG